MKSTKARLVQILLINFLFPRYILHQYHIVIGKINIYNITRYPMDSKCTNRKEIMHSIEW